MYLLFLTLRSSRIVCFLSEISFAANKYYIVGEVIDIAKKKVDFSETMIISAEEKEEDRVENFSRKIAGGTLEQWEYPIQNRETRGLLHIS